MLDDFYIIDAHSHVGNVANVFVPFDPDINIVKIMDGCNIQFSVVSSMKSLSNGESQDVLDELKRFHEDSNFRIFYYANFDPRSPSESCWLLKNNINNKGLLGIKIHPSMQETPADSDAYSDAWELAQSGREHRKGGQVDGVSNIEKGATV
jgi:predicted TIM-barrel fold metal-dependent hydrolase